MDMNRVRIADMITAEYSDFLTFCSVSGKVFISELTKIDFVTFRTSSGQSRNYIETIKTMLNNPSIVATAEGETNQTSLDSEKNEENGEISKAYEFLTQKE